MPFIRRWHAQFGVGDVRRRQLPATPMFRSFITAYDQQLEVLTFLRDHDAQHGRELEDSLKLPATAHGVLTAFAEARGKDAPRIQRVLTKRMDRYRAIKLRQADEDQDRLKKTQARLLSASEPNGSRWLSQVPRLPGLTLTNYEFGLAWRLRAGLPPDNDMPATCACKKEVRLDVEPYDHFHSCALFRRESTLDRHNNVTKTIIFYAKKTGWRCSYEPHYSKAKSAPAGSPMSQRGYTPDAALHGTSMKLHLDAMVTHPCADSHVAAACETPLSAAAKGEAQKEAAGKEWAAWAKYKFYPFVLESFGAMGKKAMEVVNIIASQPAEDVSEFPSRAAFRDRMLTAISIAVQRGNASIATQGLLQARLGFNAYAARRWQRR
jgi:hypothetical protein